MIDLPFATVYLIAFAFTWSSLVGLAAYGMAKRKQQDGTPFNFGLLKFGGGVTSVFWMLALGTFIAQA